MISHIQGFSRGLFVPLSGLRLILSSPKKLILSALPFVIGIVLFVSAVSWGYSHLGQWISSFSQDILPLSSSWLSYLKPVLGFLTWAGFIMLGFLLSYILISILAGPFLSLLAESVHKTAGGRRSGRVGSAGLMLRMFILSLWKALLFLLVALFSFILWFFPPLNIVGAFLVLLTIAFDCMDYSFEVELMPLGDRFAFFKRHIGVFSGIAVSVFATSFVPGIFFLILPAYVAGAAKLFVTIRAAEC